MGEPSRPLFAISPRGRSPGSPIPSALRGRELHLAARAPLRGTQVGQSRGRQRQPHSDPPPARSSAASYFPSDCRNLFVGNKRCTLAVRFTLHELTFYAGRLDAVRISERSSPRTARKSQFWFVHFSTVGFCRSALHGSAWRPFVR